MSDINLVELGRSLSDTLTLSGERTERFIDAFVEAVRGAVTSGKEVKLPTMGTLTLADRQGNVLPAVYPANIVADISARLQDRSDNVEPLIKGLMNAVRKELLEGRKIILDDLGTFELRREPPKIERQPRGHRLIHPAVASVSFQSGNVVRTPVGEGRLIFQIGDELRRKVEQGTETKILIVVPERDFFVKTLEYYFEKAGWAIEVITGSDQAIDWLQRNKAFLVVLDSAMADSQKVVREVKLKPDSNAVPLVLLQSEASAGAESDSPKLLGDDNFVQPFEFRELLDAADSEILRAAEEKLIFTQQLRFQVPTDEAIISKMTDEEMQKLLEQSGLGEDGQVAISAAFREAMLNAAQHGNKFKRDRKIEIQYLLDREKVTIVVQDEGPGFNHELYVRTGQTGSAIAAARERHTQGRMGGLGILLMLRCCDRLEYNPKGNQSTLTKFLKPPQS